MASTTNRANADAGVDTKTLDELEHAARAAQEGLAQLHAEQRRAQEERCQAIIAGDADRAVALQRRWDELGVRVLVAEVVRNRALLAVARGRATALEPDIERLEHEFTVTQAAWEGLVNDGAPVDEIEVARAARDGVLGRARVLHAERLEALGAIRTLDHELERLRTRTS